MGLLIFGEYYGERGSNASAGDGAVEAHSSKNHVLTTRYPVLFLLLHVFSFWLLFTTHKRPGYFKGPEISKSFWNKWAGSSSSARGGACGFHGEEEPPGAAETQSSPTAAPGTTSSPNSCSSKARLQHAFLAAFRAETKHCKFCVVCKHIVPLRARHCHECELCVCTFDHHCFWIGGCVGERNHGRFLVAVVFFTVSFLWHLRLVWTKTRWGILLYLRGRGPAAEQMAGPAAPTGDRSAAGVLVSSPSPGAARAGPLAPAAMVPAFFPWPGVLLTLVVAGFLLMVAGLLGYHLYLVSTAQTTREAWKRGVLGYTRGRKLGPFSVGFRGNWGEFLARTECLGRFFGSGSFRQGEFERVGAGAAGGDDAGDQGGLREHDPMAAGGAREVRLRIEAVPEIGPESGISSGGGQEDRQRAPRAGVWQPRVWSLREEQAPDAGGAPVDLAWLLENEYYSCC